MDELAERTMHFFSQGNFNPMRREQWKSGIKNCYSNKTTSKRTRNDKFACFRNEHLGTPSSTELQPVQIILIDNKSTNAPMTSSIELALVLTSMPNSGI